MNRAVAIIVVAQLLGTSLWFSANSAAADLQRAWGMTTAELGLLTNAVQAGFIGGTLLFSLSGLADRFGASRIVVVCALAGALCNAGFALLAHGVTDALAYRFLVGVSLAGIYPLGMKLIVSWVPDKAGMALGLLIGMLTLGTALPHGVRALGGEWSWQVVVLTSSILCAAGGLMVYGVGEGPHLRAPSSARPAGWGAVLAVFRLPAFRASAFAYFGHMWEIYAFWTVTPLLLARALGAGSSATGISALSFCVIGVGALGCIGGGIWSRRLGSARVAALGLTASATLCAVYPLMTELSPVMKVLALLVWGMAVVADSPQFSALSARACPAPLVGSALALQNAIGFVISVCAIFLATAVIDRLGDQIAWLLLPGPLLGLLALRPLLRAAPP